MTGFSTIGDLYKRGRITNEQIDAAVTAYLNDPIPGPRPLTQEIAVDVCAIMQTNPHAREILAMRDSTEAQMRMAVRTAIMLATPVPTPNADAPQDGTPEGCRADPEDTIVTET
ncbi:hypothetical protein [Methylobacterium terrae]|uniref:hypothetical protein n=1 Tax=Methylobacterium terrae TaxID=2202827 RepID=UPI001FE207C7|nr:hypothetical protein [Methylobacterium terrae]